jgi:four helix bundle protein
LSRLVRKHTDLDVYQKAFAAAMDIFELSKQFPKEEMYSLTDQMRRSSRSVCANIAEAWRNRRYEKMFISKLSIAESEAAETQVWLEFSVKCGYATRETSATLYHEYDAIISSLVGMIRHSSSWTLNDKP